MNEDPWSIRLSEYVDGDLDAVESATLEAHLEGCATCRRTVQELRHVIEQLRADPGDVATMQTWERIAEALHQDRRLHRAPSRPARPPVRHLRRWAFPIGLMALVAFSVVFRRMGSTAQEAPDVSGAFLPVSARPSEAYHDAVAELEQSFRATQGAMSPEMARTVSASLDMLNTATAETERALAADTTSTYVRRHLDRLRAEKLETLHQAVLAVHLRT